MTPKKYRKKPVVSLRKALSLGHEAAHDRRIRPEYDFQTGPFEAMWVKVALRALGVDLDGTIAAVLITPTTVVVTHVDVESCRSWTDTTLITQDSPRPAEEGQQ